MVVLMLAWRICDGKPGDTPAAIRFATPAAAQ